MATARIELRGLRAVGPCGVLPEEQLRPQPLEVDLDIEVDLAAAGASDDLDDTVDYGALCDLVVGELTNRHVALLEHLAQVHGAFPQATPCFLNQSRRRFQPSCAASLR